MMRLLVMTLYGSDCSVLAITSHSLPTSNFWENTYQTEDNKIMQMTVYTSLTLCTCKAIG